jgi:hypothetical protein
MTERHTVPAQDHSMANQTLFRWLVLPVLALLMGCSGLNLPEPAISQTALPAPEPGKPPVPASIQSVRFAIPQLQRIGSYRFGLTCSPPFSNVFPLDLRRRLNLDWWRDAAAQSLAASGYMPLYSGGDVRITGAITDLRLDLCRQESLWSSREVGSTGKGYIRINWQAVDNKGRLLSEQETEGFSALEEPAEAAAEVLAAEAFARSLARFATGLHRLDEAKARQATQPRPIIEVASLQSAVAVPEGIDLPKGYDLPAPLSGRLDRNAAHLLAALVLIESKTGTIPGAVLGHDDGRYLVLAAHPLSDGEPTLTIRDSRGTAHPASRIETDGVASPRYLSLHSDAALISLPLADAAPVVSDVVYAITTPRAELEPAISRGVVSGDCGTGSDGRKRWQADLPLSAPVMLNRAAEQTGGLLLDRHGNLLGLAEADGTGDHARLTALGADGGMICFSTP